MVVVIDSVPFHDCWVLSGATFLMLSNKLINQSLLKTMVASSCGPNLRSRT